MRRKGIKAINHYGEYADIQNLELPISTPEKIKASWRVLHTKKIKDQFDPHKLDLYKKRIIKAWKQKINPEGPPEISSENNEVSNGR